MAIVLCVLNKSVLTPKLWKHSPVAFPELLLLSLEPDLELLSLYGEEAGKRNIFPYG